MSYMWQKKCENQTDGHKCDIKNQHMPQAEKLPKPKDQIFPLLLDSTLPQRYHYHKGLTIFCISNLTKVTANIQTYEVI